MKTKSNHLNFQKVVGKTIKINEITNNERGNENNECQPV